MTGKNIKPKIFLIDVDGVLSTGQFLYTEEGKTMKIFGPDDHDGLSLLNPFLKIIFLTGDKKGFNISKKRVVDDMHFPLELVSTIKRNEWISERYSLDEVIYMGDGIFDHYVFKKVGYAISTADGDQTAKKYAHYVTKRSGGNRAIVEACLHILEKFFEPYDPDKLPKSNTKLSGEWTA